MQLLSYEEFLEKFYDEIYIMYMETGAYYDTDREHFDEMMYEDYTNGRGKWVNLEKERSILAKE